MVYEFINKVLLPRSKNRTVASAVDIFLIECLTKFELVSLPSQIIEHMYKVVHFMEGEHGMA